MRRLAPGLLSACLLLAGSCGGGDGTVDTGGGTALILINEVAPNPSIGEDWIELYNAGTGAQDLTGWTLEDSGLSPEFVAGGVVLGPGQYVVLQSQLDFSFGFSSAGDTATLRKAAGAVADTTTIPATLPDEAWGRFPNGSGPYGIRSAPTKGAENVQ